MHRYQQPAAAKPLHERIERMAWRAMIPVLAATAVFLVLAWTGVVGAADLKVVWFPLALALTLGGGVMTIAKGMKNAREPGGFRFCRVALIPVLAAAEAVVFAISHGLLPDIAMITVPAGAFVLFGLALLGDAAHDARQTGYNPRVYALSLAAIGLMLMGSSGLSAATRTPGAGLMFVAALAMFGSAGLAEVISNGQTEKR